MLATIPDLPEPVWGLDARGRVAKRDYDEVVHPYLERAQQAGRRVRLLYRMGRDFAGFTPAGALADMRTAIRYADVFERRAIVTDVAWMRRAAQLVGPLLPYPGRAFDLAGWSDALEWLAAAPTTSLSYRILQSRGVLVLELHGKLRAEDFDTVEHSVQTWLDETGGSLSGAVIYAPAFPGWHDPGSLFRLVRLVRHHPRAIRRVALAIDGNLPRIASPLIDPWLRAEIEHFPTSDLGRAITWASRQQAEDADAARSP